MKIKPLEVIKLIEKTWPETEEEIDKLMEEGKDLPPLDDRILEKLKRKIKEKTSEN